MVFSLRREAMNEKRCRHCQEVYFPNPRVKDQQYCNRQDCQRERKTIWQRQKIHQDPDYKANQKECWENWRKRNPGYWKNYRQQHPPYQERNRLLQRVRNTQRRSVLCPGKGVVKMDALTHCFSFKPGLYHLIPLIAKMDALTPKCFIVPAAYPGGP